jgi:hypothetical protein
MLLATKDAWMCTVLSTDLFVSHLPLLQSGPTSSRLRVIVAWYSPSSRMARRQHSTQLLICRHSPKTQRISSVTKIQRISTVTITRRISMMTKPQGISWVAHQCLTPRVASLPSPIQSMNFFGFRTRFLE